VASLVRANHSYDIDDGHVMDNYMIPRNGRLQYWLVLDTKKAAGHGPAA